jgi:hypothetical protein
VTEADALAWLLEPSNPSARFLALTGLLGRGADDAEVVAAQSAIPGWGPARAILAAQWPEGYWMRPGVGYSPKYKATVWQVIFLAALGTPRTEAVERACAYVLDHSRLPDGRFSAHKTAKGAVACLNGNLVRAMSRLGCADPRVEQSREALAEMVARDAFCCRFHAVAPRPSRMRDGLPCAWGAIKALGAFAEVPAAQRSPAVGAAIEAGVAFLLGGEVARGGYPTATTPSPLWRRPGFPLGYSADLVEALEVLARLEAPHCPEVDAALAVVLEKRDESGRWALEHTPDNAWADFGQRGQPNKWVTLRALRVLRWWGRDGASSWEGRT